MECLDHVEVPAQGVAVEGDKDNIVKRHRNKLEAGVWFRTCNGFVVKKDTVDKFYVRLLQSIAKHQRNSCVNGVY